MKKLAFSLLTALVVLAAFAQSENPTIEETISALNEGLRNQARDVALQNINSWRETLEASDDTALRIIGVQLGDLAVALETEPVNVQEASRMLITLGKGVIVVGEDRGNDQVVTLGDSLTQAGTSLYVAAEEDGASDEGGMTGGGE